MSLYPSLEDMMVDRTMKVQLQTESLYVTTTSESINTGPSAPAISPVKESLYPRLGNYADLEFNEVAVAQNLPGHATTNRQIAESKADSQCASTASGTLTSSASSVPLAPTYGSTRDRLYPFLGDYMGLELSETVIAENMPEYAIANRQIGEIIRAGSQIGEPLVAGMIAPLSGDSRGLERARVTNGIREVVLRKDRTGKLGIRVHSVNNGVFVCLVSEGSPAALAGLRFGDQVLEINGTSLAGYSMDQVHKLLRKVANDEVRVVVRDRPFERTVTMHKDSAGHIGFQFKDGRIMALVKDSSAARNGLLTDHQLLEINGKNVVGLKDKHITAEIANNGGNVVTVTIIPAYIYDHMVKKMSGSLLKSSMDHSLPNL